MDTQQVDEVVEPLQISSLVDGSLIYGRENDKRNIVDFILSHVFNDSIPIVICIVAASGFGKSTMLHLICNDQNVRDAFDKEVFLCVSKRFDEKRLMKEVLQSLMCSCHDIDELSILEDIVKEELMEKKLLLVLDNAENQNQSFWNYVSILINAGAKGSLALVTKQSEMVGDVMEGMHTYHLDNLSYYHCWAILKHHAFGDCDRNVSPVLEEIGKLLISKCNYSPFCIRVIGMLLSHSVSENWWADILENNAWETTTFRGDILPALRVCYNYMPTYLKNCFSYSSLFPRDYIFPKHYIIRLWIAQGFIVSMEGREPEEIGIQYFDELVQRSFFQHFPIDNANKDKFIMHELIHYLAENASCDSCFRSEDGNCSIPAISHFSLASPEPQTIQLEHLVEEVRELRTCLFINRSKFQQAGVFPITSLVGLNDLFRSFSNIIALDVSHTNVVELPDSIGLLQSLHFLGINNTKIKHLPLELCSLVNIQTMEARNCDNLAELPEQLSQLTNLRYLDVWKESGHVLMPLGIGKLTNLQNLATFSIGDDSLHATVGELKNLNGLGDHLQITGLENVRSMDEAIEATLKSKSKIEALTLHWSGSVQYGRGEADVAFTEELLKNLEPNNNLQELIVKNYTGTQFPTWIGDPLFSMLVSVILDGCFNCKNFPDLSELPSLKCLSLRKMRGVQNFIDPDRRSLMKRSPMFQSLELLNLWEMYDLEELFEVEDGDFPRLRTISINRCSVLRKLPQFPSLVELSFHSCTRLPEIAALSSLKILKFGNFRNMKQLYLPPKLTVLKRLELSYCSELLSVNGLLQTTSIEKILLIRCPKIDLLHNHEQYNFKKVNVTRSRQEIHRLDDSHGNSIRESCSGDMMNIEQNFEHLFEQAHSPTNSNSINELFSQPLGSQVTDETARGTLGRHVPHDMMGQMGLFDTPSQCNVNISPFDGDLLQIDLPDVERLAPLSLVGSGPGTSSNITKADELSVTDASDSVTIEGTSKVEVENAKLKAELASAIVIICGLNAEVGFFETSENRDQFEKMLKEMKEKTEKALVLKDDYANHLQSMLNSKQEQCISYEKRIKELEQRLSERYVQGQRDTSLKALEQMDESSSATSAFVEKITAPARQPSKNILEGGDENMIDLISGSGTNNNPSVDSARNSMDTSMNQTGDAEKEERLELRDDAAVAGGAGTGQDQVRQEEEAVMELWIVMEEKTNLLDEAEEKIRALSEEVKSLTGELEHSRNLLDESQMNCAHHLENCLHEAREEARTHKCAAERRASEYEALRSSALKIHSLFERLRVCVTTPGVPGLADSLRSLSLSLASSSKKDEGDEFQQCIKVLSDKVGFMLHQSTDLSDQCRQMETTQSHLVRKLEEKEELIRNLYAKLRLEKQARKEKISFGRLEVHELAAFVRNPSGNYEAVNRNYSNYYLSDESVALFTEQHSTQPAYIIGQIVHIERRVVQSDVSGSRSGSGSQFGLNSYNLPVGSEYFVVTVALLPDTIRSSAS